MTTRLPIFHSAVFVVLQNDKGEVLLQKRQNTGYMDDRYDGSMSGHVEPGESITQAAVRESAEEVNVAIDESDLELIAMFQMDVDRAYLNYVFLCRTWHGVPVISEPDKASHLEWFALDNLPGQLAPTMALLRERQFQADTSRVEYVDATRQERLIG